MFYAIVTVAVLILDQAVKLWTNKTLAIGEAREFIPGFIELTHYQNTGAAFGFLDNVSFARWLFVILVVIFSIAVIAVLSKDVVKGATGRWLLALIMAGGLGNGIDRVINGYVVDMFSFKFMEFAVFNVADIFITLGGIAFCVWFILQKPEAVEVKEAPAPRRRNYNRSMDELFEQHQTDYLSLLEMPTTQAREDLEQQRAETAAQAAAQARKEALKKGEPLRPRQAPAPAAPIDPNDPFAEFLTGGTSSAEQKAANPAPSPNPAPMPSPAPAPAPNPAPAPQPKEKNFTLDDILAEFSNK